MRPTLSITHKLNSTSGNTELFGKISRGDAIFSFFSYLKDLFFGDLTSPVFFAFRSSATRKTPLIRCVSKVFFLSSKKKVPGSNAISDITFMTNKKTIWDRAIRQLPRMSVGPNGFTANADSGVSCGVFGWVKPTTIGFFNLRPEFFHAGHLTSGVIYF